MIQNYRGKLSSASHRISNRTQSHQPKHDFNSNKKDADPCTTSKDWLLIVNVSPARQAVKGVLRNGSSPRHGNPARMWSSISKQVEKLAKKGGSAVALLGRRAPRFGVDGTAGGGTGHPALPERVVVLPRRAEGNEKRQQRRQQAGDGKQQRDSQKKNEGFAELPKPVIMAAAAKVAKRVPLIRFPNRRGGEKQGAVAVNRAVGSGGGQSQAMPSLPSGTASSQPPRTKLTEAEIEAILLGGAAP